MFSISTKIKHPTLHGKDDPTILQNSPTEANSDSTCWKENLACVWSDFLADTSLHGCKNLAHKRRKAVARCVWATMLLGMAVSVTAVLVEMYLRYKEYPFTTKWHLNMLTEVPMPALTFCINSGVDAEKMDNLSPAVIHFLRSTGLEFELTPVSERERISENQMEAIDNRLDKITWGELHKQAGFSVEDIVILVQANIKSKRKTYPPSSTYKVPSQDMRSSCFISDLTPFNGGDSASMSEYDDITLVLNIPRERFVTGYTGAGVDLYIHEWHGITSSTKSISIRPGTSARVLFTTTNYTFLPLPYESFGVEGCVDTLSPDFVNPLKSISKYTSVMCTYEKAYNYTASICNCTLTYMVDIFKIPECSVKQVRDCFTPELERYLIDGNGSADCLHACSYLQYDVTVSGMDFPAHQPNGSDLSNLMVLTIQPATIVMTTVEHVPEMTLMDIFGNVGGYLGLFLGASLLTLTELFEAILLSVWILHSRMFHGRQQERLHS